MNSRLLESIAETTTHRDRETLHSSIARLILEFLEAELVTIYQLVDDGGGPHLSSYIEVRHEGKRRPRSPEAVDTSATHPDALIIQRLADVPEWEECVRLKKPMHFVPSLGTVTAVLPVAADRGVAGLLVVRGRKRFADRDLQHVGSMLRILANHLALLDYSQRDNLTQLFNRQTFEAAFLKRQQRVMDLAKDADMANSCWLGLVDVDKFQQINDTYGHLFGDEMVLLVSQILPTCFRASDSLYRFAGGEFAVVLDHATVAGARTAFERLRAKIEGFSFPQVGQMAISLGYTRLLESDGPDSGIERADAALFYAKRNGRNQVRSFDELLAAGEVSVARKRGDAEIF